MTEQTKTVLHLNDAGRRLVARGGDAQVNPDNPEDDDAMVIMELMSRAPGCTEAQYVDLFVNLRLEYGKNALDALRKGYVEFRERK